MTARELEQVFHVSNPAMSGVLKRMEQKGMIVRSPGLTDGRNKSIRLAVDVDEFVETVRGRIWKEKERLFGGLSQAEIEGFEHTLYKIFARLKAGMAEEIQRSRS